jgi:hypothetical protein
MAKSKPRTKAAPDQEPKATPKQAPYKSPFASAKALAAFPSRTKGPVEAPPSTPERQKIVRQKVREANKLIPKPTFDKDGNAKQHQHTSPEFKRLQAQWDQILELTGFDDIELGGGAYGERNTPYLANSDNKLKPSTASFQLAQLQEWFIAQTGRHTLLERDVVALTIKGHGIDKIAQILSLRPSAVNRTLKACQTRARKWSSCYRRYERQELLAANEDVEEAEDTSLEQQILEEFAEAQSLQSQGWIGAAPTLEEITLKKASAPPSVAKLFDDPMKAKDKK